MGSLSSKEIEYKAYSIVVMKRGDIVCVFFIFFFQAEDGIRDLTVTGVQTCALPIYDFGRIADKRERTEFLDLPIVDRRLEAKVKLLQSPLEVQVGEPGPRAQVRSDRKSTRLNSSHSQISYAVFCLKKKKQVIGDYHN